MADATPTTYPSFEDILGCQAALFEWAESYDTKDWNRLAECLAPNLRVDYRAYGGKLWETLPAAELVRMASSPHFLGNKRIKTQHLVGGASKWIKISQTEVTGHHQMRVAHQRYADDDLKSVQFQGHAYGKGIMHYRKVDGFWKFAGLEPDISWTEFDHDKIFGA